MAYRFAGKQKTLALGVYPTVSLQEAREKRDAAKRSLANRVETISIGRRRLVVFASLEKLLAPNLESGE